MAYPNVISNHLRQNDILCNPLYQIARDRNL